jgi:hypothetical protein
VADAARAVPDAGRPDPSTRLRIYFPTQASWDAGMRSAVCVLIHIDHSAMSGDALDGSGLTPLQRQALTLTNESVLLRVKLHDVPRSGWKIGAALEQRLGQADRAESSALAALASDLPSGASADLGSALRGLAAVDATEASKAEADAAAVTSADAWQSRIGAGLQTFPPADAAYRILRTALGLPEPGA